MQRQIGQLDTVFQDNNMITDNQQIELFIRHFENECEQYSEQKEDQLRQSVESINDQMVRLIDQYKQIQSNNMQSNDNQQTIIVISSIKQNYEQIINQSEQIINQQRSRYDQMMMKHDRRLQQIRQLQECENEVYILYYSKLDKYKKQIEKYEKNDKQYQIVINFGWCCSFPSIDNKMEVIEIIDILNANSKVAKIEIELSRDKWNSEMVKLMINRYTNVHNIIVVDCNDQIDHQMHGLIKQYVQQQPIMQFKLCFDGSLYDDNYGYQLIKQYDQLIKQKQYLEYLVYQHNRIGGIKSFNTKQKIKKSIDRLDKS